MGALKTVGGVFALVAGTLNIVVLLLAYMGAAVTPMILIYSLSLAVSPIGGIIGLALNGLLLVGGILGLAGKKAGGILALIAAAFIMLEGILISFVFNPFTQPELILMFNPWSFFVGFVGLSISFLTIEAILGLLGGIFILAGGSD
ncbi:MAG: hypothetical protein HWN65_22990 [Candidatus Helarchaeota archaeon]|nr:hypothetical protein [Candidatus Helarchaeota archaeon]